MSNKVIFLYGLFLFVVIFLSYTFIEVRVFRTIFSGFASENRITASTFFLLMLSFFFSFYTFFVTKIATNKINISKVWGIIFLSSFILLFSYPAMLSHDIFNYFATAKVAFYYHENPYVVMPIEIAGDPLFDIMHAANKTALYGPAWILLTAIPHVIGFQSLVFTLLSFKIFIIAFYLATTFLIWKLSKNLQSVALFALNPLVIIETLVSSHNDIVMMFFVLSSFFLIQKNKKVLSFVFFLISILIKYATFFLLPTFLYVFWIKKAEINWQKIYGYSLVLMLIVFFLSPIREEIYPWYAIWFLTFTSLINKKKINVLAAVFSFSLLLRYVPFMLLGTYAGVTPFIKTGVTFILPLLLLLYYSIKKYA